MSDVRTDDVRAEIRWAVESLETALKNKHDADAVVEMRRHKLALAIEQAHAALEVKP